MAVNFIQKLQGVTSLFIKASANTSLVPGWLSGLVLLVHCSVYNSGKMVQVSAKQKERHRHKEQTMDTMRGKGGDATNWEIGVDIYTLTIDTVYNIGD